MNDNKMNLGEAVSALDFLADDEVPVHHKALTPYKVIIADDDHEMHSATKILLRDFIFEDRTLEFIDVYNGPQAMKAVEDNPDAAIILLDVVMDSSDSGLKVVNYIRKTLNNKNIRIILRTGQPGEAPEERIIVDYDINDYRLKTELTVQRLYTSMYEALRSYRDIRNLEHHKMGLEKIIHVSASLFSQESLKSFYNCILNQLMTFRNESSVYFREKQNGIVIVEEEGMNHLGIVIAATGRFESHVGEPIREISELSRMRQFMLDQRYSDSSDVIELDGGFLVSRIGCNQTRSFIFIEAEALDFDIELMQTLLFHYSEALDNFVSNILKE